MYVECPTSKVRVFHDFLDMFIQSKLACQNCVYIPVGTRVGLLGTLTEAIARKFPNRPCFVVLLSVGQQSMRVRPSYAVYVPMDAKADQVATHVCLKGCRAMGLEGIRLRCTNPRCEWRDARETSADDEMFEIPKDDLEDAELDACFEQDEEDPGDMDVDDAADVGVDADADAGCSASAADASGASYKVNLWPHAAPIAAHKRVLSVICRSAEKSHLLLFTRSAHPGLIIAGREFGLKVLALQQGCSQHSVAHGRSLMKTIMVARNGIVRSISSTSG